jgi:hypothetical protein
MLWCSMACVEKESQVCQGMFGTLTLWLFIGKSSTNETQNLHLYCANIAIARLFRIFRLPIGKVELLLLSCHHSLYLPLLPNVH